MDKINELVHSLVNTAVDDGAIMAVPLAAQIVSEFQAIESKLDKQRDAIEMAKIVLDGHNNLVSRLGESERLLSQEREWHQQECEKSLALSRRFDSVSKRKDAGASLIAQARAALNHVGVVEGVDSWTERADEWLEGETRVVEKHTPLCYPGEHDYRPASESRIFSPETGKPYSYCKKCGASAPLSE